MKTSTTAGFAALMLLAISCTKENPSIQSSRIDDESIKQVLLTNADETDEPASITIGTQIWMKRDLTRSHYRNGDTIPEVKSTVE